MRPPICQKCGDSLEYREDSSAWICRRCGSKHVYERPSPTVEALSLQRMGGKIKACEDQTLDASLQIELILSQLNTLCMKSSRLSENERKTEKIEELAEAFQSGFKLLQDSFDSSNRLIEELQVYCTPIGGGHFKLIE